MYCQYIFIIILTFC